VPKTPAFSPGVRLEQPVTARAAIVAMAEICSLEVFIDGEF